MLQNHQNQVGLVNRKRTHFSPTHPAMNKRRRRRRPGQCV
jgi:hypothetical protein